MSFGKRLLEARKAANLSQKEVADKLNTKAPVIGRYERDEARPSIDAAAKLADLLNVSLDYLVGNTQVNVDSNTLSRVLELQLLSTEEQQTVFKLLDAFIRDAKTKQTYG